MSAIVWLFFPTAARVSQFTVSLGLRASVFQYDGREAHVQFAIRFYFTGKPSVDPTNYSTRGMPLRSIFRSLANLHKFLLVAIVPESMLASKIPFKKWH